MPTTFTADLSTDRSKVRFLVGDWKTGRMILDDDTIDSLVTLAPSYGKAAVSAARALEAYYADQVSTSNGRLSVGAESRMRHYGTLALKLSKQGDDPLVSGGRNAQAVPAYAGGISRAAKDADNLNTDLVQPQFKRNQHDMPGISTDHDPSWE